MKNFIEVVSEDNRKHLININHIEEIAEVDEKNCCIYTDVVYDNEAPNYYFINEPYEVIKKLIESKEGDE